MPRKSLLLLFPIRFLLIVAPLAKAAYPAQYPNEVDRIALMDASLPKRRKLARRLAHS